MSIVQQKSNVNHTYNFEFSSSYIKKCKETAESNVLMYLFKPLYQNSTVQHVIKIKWRYFKFLY